MLKRAADAGVGMICVGTDWGTSRAAIDLAARHDNIWATVGLHPNDNEQESGNSKQKLQDTYAKLIQEQKVVAVGEVGLDYYRTPGQEKQEHQREIFQWFVELASEYKKPLVVHCRDAHQDMVDILQASSSKLQAGGVIHSFTGTYADAKRYIDLGFYIGLNGIITFARQYDDTVIEISLERVLLETDAPYLTPEPHRGKRNEPAYVLNVAEQIARLRKIPVELVAQATTRNAVNLFNLHETV